MRHLQSSVGAVQTAGTENRLAGLVNGALQNLTENQNGIFSRLKDMRTRLLGSAPESVEEKAVPGRPGTLGRLEDQIQYMEDLQQKIFQELETLTHSV